MSVIVPARNCSDTLAECVSALLAQDYPRELTEVVIVDNGSTDATQSVASRFPVIVLSERAIRSSYAARNRGIAHATGHVLAFTDADCVPDPSWLRDLVAPFADETVAAVVGRVDDGRADTVWQELIRDVQPFARPERGGLKTLLTLNVAIRRSVLDALGHFDEHMPTGGDVDFGWRMQQGGLRIVEASEARVVHRHRATLRGVFSQFRRYGMSEILLATLHPNNGAALPLRAQLRLMLSQVRAMMSYCLALGFRTMVSVARGFDLHYLARPVLLLAVEGGSLAGKLEALAATRGCRRNPFPNARLGRTA